MSVRVVPESELAYCRERVVAWCSKPFPDMTLGQAQHLALLLAIERSKVFEQHTPPRQRRICNPEGLPVTLPAPVDENEITNPQAKVPTRGKR